MSTADRTNDYADLIDQVDPPSDLIDDLQDAAQQVVDAHTGGRFLAIAGIDESGPTMRFVDRSNDPNAHGARIALEGVPPLKPGGAIPPQRFVTVDESDGQLLAEVRMLRQLVGELTREEELSRWIEYYLPAECSHCSGPLTGCCQQQGAEHRHDCVRSPHRFPEANRDCGGFEFAHTDTCPWLRARQHLADA